MREKEIEYKAYLTKFEGFITLDETATEEDILLEIFRDLFEITYKEV